MASLKDKNSVANYVELHIIINSHGGYKVRQKEINAGLLLLNSINLKGGIR